MTTRRVAIIGGGVAGLATAYRILRTASEQSFDVQVGVVESERVGGKIRTDVRDGYVCEAGPNGFLDNEPATLRLVDDLGLRDSLVRSHDSARRRFLLRRGTLHELEMNPVKFMRSPLLSRWGRVRAGCEFFVKPYRGDKDETIGEFGRRRLGKEFTQVLLDSMVSGIFAGDVDRLSLRAAFPRVAEMEQKYGGLLKALREKRREVRARVLARRARAANANSNNASGKDDAPETERSVASAAGVLHSFRGGMGQLTDSLAQALGEDHIRTNLTASRVIRSDAGDFRVVAGAETWDVDAVVLAVPAPVAAQLVAELAPPAARSLGEVSVAGVHVVCTGFSRAQVSHDLLGFGALVPRKEHLRSLGTLWTSSIFEGRSPEGTVLLRTMVGGAHDPGANELTDEELVSLVLREITPVYGIKGEPSFVHVARWSAGIPQYERGHDDRIASAREALPPGVFLTGNSVAGIGVNHCVAHSEVVSSQVLEFLTQVPAANGATA